MPTAFQHVQKPADVGIDVVVRRRERMTHARLGGEMDHVRKTVIGEQCGDAVAVGEIELVKAKFVVAREFREPRLLELGVVIGIEVIDSNDVASILQQTPRNMEANKSGGA